MADQASASDQADMLEESGAAIGLSLRPPKMSVLVPEEDNRFMVTNDQLELLCRGGKDTSFDMFIFLFGGAIGFAQNLLGLLVSYYQGKEIAGVDIVFGLVCVGCVAGAVAKYTEYSRNKRDTDHLLAKLKTGRKVDVA